MYPGQVAAMSNFLPHVHEYDTMQWMLPQTGKRKGPIGKRKRRNTRHPVKLSFPSGKTQSVFLACSNLENFLEP